ncbi:hypothetical protein WA588_002165, partial [Blastocystis sp. NMH]
MEIKPTKVSASSECKHENKVRRAKCVIDDNDMTFWFSDKPLPQYLLFSFDSPTDISSIEITFQGGFASESVQFSCGNDDGSFSPVGAIQYVDDSNAPQVYHRISTLPEIPSRSEGRSEHPGGVY